MLTQRRIDIISAWVLAFFASNTSEHRLEAYSYSYSFSSYPCSEYSQCSICIQLRFRNQWTDELFRKKHKFGALYKTDSYPLNGRPGVNEKIFNWSLWQVHWPPRMALHYWKSSAVCWTFLRNFWISGAVQRTIRAGNHMQMSNIFPRLTDSSKRKPDRSRKIELCTWIVAHFYDLAFQRALIFYGDRALLLIVLLLLLKCF